MANKVLPYLHLYMSNSEKGSTHQIHMEEVVLGLHLQNIPSGSRGRHKVAGIFVLL